jgi:hypothetical protein
MTRQARLPASLSIVLLGLALLVTGGAAGVRAGSNAVAAVGSHDSRARAEFRAPIAAAASSRAADTDRPFMCRDKGMAPIDDWD